MPDLKAADFIFVRGLEITWKLGMTADFRVSCYELLVLAAI
jgi:hypothetical protein